MDVDLSRWCIRLTTLFVLDRCGGYPRDAELARSVPSDGLRCRHIRWDATYSAIICRSIAAGVVPGEKCGKHEPSTEPDCTGGTGAFWPLEFGDGSVVAA
jgi:hypothetical protein